MMTWMMTEFRMCGSPSSHPLQSLSRRGEAEIKESAMMLDWNEYRKQLAAGVKEINNRYYKNHV